MANPNFNNPAKFIELTAQEIDSELWRKLKKELNAQLERVRDELEKTVNDEIKTAILRGRAKQIRLLLSMGNGKNEDPLAAQATEKEYR